MKTGTMELMKFKRLQRALGESKRGIAGLLELMWHGVCANCPAGDIGKFDHEEIAILCDWEGDPDELVAALVKSGWLDEHPDHGLVVHDWHEHAPNYIKGTLARYDREFANLSASPGEVPLRTVPRGPSSEEPPQSTLPPSLAKPNLTKPNLNQTKPRASQGARGGGRSPSLDEVREWVEGKGYKFDPEAFWDYYEARDWTLKDGPVKRWKALCASWDRREGKFGPNGATPSENPMAAVFKHLDEKEKN